MKGAKAKLEKSLGGDAFPLDYSTTLRVVRDALHAVSPAPVVVSEGANTMDNARWAFPVHVMVAMQSNLSLFRAVWGSQKASFTGHKPMDALTMAQLSFYW